MKFKDEVIVGSEEEELRGILLGAIGASTDAAFTDYFVQFADTQRWVKSDRVRAAHESPEPTDLSRKLYEARETMLEAYAAVNAVATQWAANQETAIGPSMNMMIKAALALEAGITDINIVLGPPPPTAREISLMSYVGALEEALETAQKGEELTPELRELIDEYRLGVR